MSVTPQQISLALQILAVVRKWWRERQAAKAAAR